MLRRVWVSLTVVCLISLTASCSDDTAQQGNTTGEGGSPAEGITVVGTGQISGEPDTFRATVGVEVERQNVDEALNVANEAAEQVISTMREQGVEEQNIQTTEFSVFPVFNEPPMQGQSQDGPGIRGYVVTNLVEARIQNLERVGEILQAAVEAGGDAARVRSVNFTLEDNEELRAAAREAAFADARRRANNYAELAERELGPLVSVSETVEDSAPLEPSGGMPASAGAEAQSVPVTPGEEEVTVRIKAVWEIR